jgi:hydrogenase maturation factor
VVSPHECLTCGDVAAEGLVVEIHGDTATVEIGGKRTEVGAELVLPVEPGDLLLCHAGIAIRKVDG